MPVPNRSPDGDRSFAPWTRRQFLKALGAVAVVASGVGAVVHQLTSGSPAPTANPVPGATVGPLGAIDTNSPTAPGGASASLAPGAGRSHYRSRPDLTPPQITINASNGGTAPGFIFFTPNNGGGTDGPTIVDETGELVWLHPDTGLAATNFRPLSYRGQTVLAWWEGKNNNGVGAGEHVLVDASYRELTRIRAGNGLKADLHELQLTARGTAYVFAAESADAPAGAWPAATASSPAAGSPATPAAGSPAAATPVVGSAATPAAHPQVLDDQIQEVDIATGRVLFEWHCLGHIDLDESLVAPPTGADQAYDYVHLNSIDVDGDGNLLVSARNSSAIYKVDRASGVIVWRLGGKKSDFAMGEGATFGWQHDARWQPDGTLTIYDDGAAPGHSRAIVLRLDETAMTAQLVRAYNHPDNLLSTSQGNMEILPNGNVFVGWGSQPFFSEFGSDGRLLYDATFPAGKQSYRDLRAPWVSRPLDLPVVAVSTGADGTLTAYASWNGATEVASWEVLVGNEVSQLRAVATAARNGFETAVPVRAAAAFIAVRARDRSNRTLGMSTAISVSG